MTRTYEQSQGEKCGISDYVIYNKQEKKIMYWEHPYKERLEEQLDQLKQQKNKDHVVIDNFIEKVYLAFKKGNSNNWNEDDLILEQVVIEFIRLLVDSMIGFKGPIESDSINYICVVPSMWEYEIREKLLRPIFVKTGLISKTDHKDRLLFLSDIESLFYFTQCHESAMKKLTSGYCKVNDHYILCRLNILGASATSSINLDLIEAQHTLFNISDGLLYPRVISSSPLLSISEDGIKITLKNFLKSVIFSGDINSDQSNVILMITEYIYSSIRSRMTIFHYPDTVVDNLKMPWITIDAKWKLNKSQTDYLKTLSMFNICLEIGETVLDAMKALFTNSKTKQCRVLLFYENMFIQHKTVFLWARAILESITYSLNYLSSKNEKTIRINYYRDSCLIGAVYYFIDVIQNSDINSRPRILPSKEPALSTSVVSKPKVNVILNIDISFSSTLLSYILVKENESIETKPNNNNCGFNKCLPSLGLFCKFSDAATLTVNEK
ncbi:hypothetical protein BD770DRAFT_55094 [Pilaira anomala]|nr:hypothetical protein BD770DRAFT_55094 [Pilaira anomala]